MTTATLEPEAPAASAPAPAPAAKSDFIESFNPANGEKIGQMRINTPEEVAAAVVRARAAQKVWQALGVAGRNAILKKLQQVMLRRADEIITILNRENGKPRAEATTMIVSVCEGIDYYTGLAKKFAKGKKESPSKLFFGAKARVFFEPRGVAGFIMPWNFPFELGMKHMIPALAAGNAVVQKPSEHNPFVGELIASLYNEAGVPDGVVQVVHGYGDIGAALIDNVDVITFIGSPRTGSKIMARAAERLIPVILELGGNDAAIIRKDADLDHAAQGLITGAFLNAGQTCVSVERVYAHKDIIDSLTQKILDRTAKLRQNTGDDYYDVGPIKWAPQRKVYEAQLADAVAKGATVRTGGHVIDAHGGMFMQPTVLTGVTHDMEIMKEETFGPILPIMPFSTDEEAIKLANDTVYGLGGSVWSADTERANEIAQQVVAGHVMINNAVVSAACPSLPFGGNGQSGVGRAFGELGYFNYTSPRSILATPVNKMGRLGWMPYSKHSEKFLLALGHTLYGGSLGEKLKGVITLLKTLPKL